MDLKDKTILVTGGGGGLGRELVLALLYERCNVIAVDIDENGLKEICKLTESNEHFTCYVIDIADTKSVASMMKVILANRNVDIVINNAGIIQPFVCTEQLSVDRAKRIFDVNFWGAFGMIHTFLSHLKERPVAQIVNVSSIGGLLPVPGQSVYCASKAAVKMLSESLSVELQGSNVRVITIFPGAMNTKHKEKFRNR